MFKNRMIFAFLLLHPLWMVLRPIRDLLSYEFLQIAYLFDLGLAVLAVHHLVPFLSFSRRMRPPSKLKVTLGGFQYKTTRLDGQLHLLSSIAVGVVLSTVGMAIWIATDAILDPIGHDWLFNYVPRVVYIGVSEVGHFVLQLALMATPGFLRLVQQPTFSVELNGRVLSVNEASLVLSPHTTSEIEGQVLTLTDGEQSLRLEGPLGNLLWLVEQVSGFQDRGGRDEVPEALRTVVDSQR